MDRTDRLPTRVSKACDRCRRQKQRCDLDRPCRHCVHAQTECTNSSTLTAVKIKKARVRKQSAAQISTPALDVSEETPKTSYPQPIEESAAFGIGWSPPVHINSNDVPMPASSPIPSQSMRSQSNREGSSIPGFDADSSLAITQKIFRSQESPSFRERATFAIPGGNRRTTGNGTSGSNGLPSPLLPVGDILGTQLPSYEVCNKLLETYFSAVHWFSLVIYEPKFRLRYDTIMASGLASRNDRGFLLLITIVLVMACWYTPTHSARDLGLSNDELEALRTELLSAIQREFMEFMDEESLEFVQVCTLLGSFYLYHGKPRSSFSILGAATKTSQALNLHRNTDARWSLEDKEERIRVWWTIYTWDRFATITYGRPFSINDKDCSAPMPSDFLENVHFDPRFQVAHLCLSTYQRQLNLAYQIASPLLEDIYGMRASHDGVLYSKLPEMVAVANLALLQWQKDLPPHLSYDVLNDPTPDSSSEEKAHNLQALSLQLTFDNLMIVLHRPLLAGHGTRQPGIAVTDESNSQGLPFTESMRETGFKRCLKSALRISNVQRKPYLFSLARSSHLVSFLGMNTFTASVVLFICALSDTLSDTAQEAKRALKRTLQMQKSLAKHASLSMQCTSILEDLVQLILKKEMEEMLQDDVSNEEEFSKHASEADSAMNGQQSGIGFENGEMYVDSSDFNQSLKTLQRVFQDSSMLRQQDNNPISRNETGNAAVLNGHQVGLGPQDFGYNERNLTGVDDLGQVWLWDLDNMNF